MNVIDRITNSLMAFNMKHLTPENRELMIRQILEKHLPLRVYRPRNLPEPGEMWIKEWSVNEMNRTGLGRTAIHQRLHGGKYPNVTLRKVNKRVVFVRVN